MSQLLHLETIDHQMLLKLSQSKVVHGASVIGGEHGWQIMIKYGNTEQYLSSTNSKQVRIFRKLETAIFYLRDLGIEEVTVKVGEYNPKISTRVRPDRTEVLKKRHAMAKTALLGKKTKKTT